MGVSPSNDRQSGMSHFVPILILGVVVGGGLWLYQNYGADVYNSDAAKAIQTPSLLQQKFPHAHKVVDEISKTLGPARAYRIGQRFQNNIQKIEDVEQKDGHDRTRTSNVGSSATMYSWKQEGCLDKSIQITFNKASTNSSSGQNTRMVGNVYLFQWNRCNGVSTSLSGFFPITDPASKAQFTTNGTSSAKLVMNSTPVTLTGTSSKNVKITADCSITGTGFTNKDGNSNYYIIEGFQSNQKSDNAWRSGAVSCQNSISVDTDVYPISTSPAAGYLNEYKWSSLLVNR